MYGMSNQIKKSGQSSNNITLDVYGIQSSVSILHK